VLKGRCPNLLREAGLYQYEDGLERKSETPRDANNHALAALRYLIATLDARRMSRIRDELANGPDEHRPRNWTKTSVIGGRSTPAIGDGRGKFQSESCRFGAGEMACRPTRKTSPTDPAELSKKPFTSRPAFR